MRIQIWILGFKGLIVSAYKVTRLCATFVHTLRIVKRDIGRYQVRKQIRTKARSHEFRPTHDRV